MSTGPATRWGTPPSGYNRGPPPPSWASPGSTSTSLPQRESPTRGREETTQQARWQQYRPTSPGVSTGLSSTAHSTTPRGVGWPPPVSAARPGQGHHSISPARKGTVSFQNPTNPHPTTPSALKTERTAPSNVELQRLRDAVAAAEARVQQFERIDSKPSATSPVAPSGNDPLRRAPVHHQASTYSGAASAAPITPRLASGAGVGSAAYLTRATPAAPAQSTVVAPQTTAPPSRPVVPVASSALSQNHVTPQTSSASASVSASSAPHRGIMAPTNPQPPTQPPQTDPSEVTQSSTANVLSELRSLISESRQSNNNHNNDTIHERTNTTEIRSLLKEHQKAMEGVVAEALKGIPQKESAPAPSDENVTKAAALYEALQAREAGLEERERRVASGEAALQARTAQTAEVEARLAELEEMRAALRRREESHEASVASREQNLLQREAALNQREESIAARDSNLITRETQLLERETLLKETENETAHRDAHNPHRTPSPRSPISQGFEGILPNSYTQDRSAVESLPPSEEADEKGKVLATFVAQKADVVAELGSAASSEAEEKGVEEEEEEGVHGMPHEGGAGNDDMMAEMQHYAAMGGDGGDDFDFDGMTDEEVAMMRMAGGMPEIGEDEAAAIEYLMQTQGVPVEVAMAMQGMAAPGMYHDYEGETD